MTGHDSLDMTYCELLLAMSQLESVERISTLVARDVVEVGRLKG